MSGSKERTSNNKRHGWNQEAMQEKRKQLANKNRQVLAHTNNTNDLIARRKNLVTSYNNISGNNISGLIAQNTALMQEFQALSENDHKNHKIMTNLAQRYIDLVDEARKNELLPVGVPNFPIIDTDLGDAFDNRADNLEKAFLKTKHHTPPTQNDMRHVNACAKTIASVNYLVATGVQYDWITLCDIALGSFHK